MGTRSLNEMIDKNGLTLTVPDFNDVGIEDENDDDTDDDEVLSSCSRKLPITTSSTCHHLD